MEERKEFTSRQYQAKELEEAFHKVEQLNNEELIEFDAKIAHIFPELELVLKYAMWSQYDLLAKINENSDLPNMARGGINVLDIVLQFIEGRKSDYLKRAHDRKEEHDTDIHSPI